MPRIKTDSKFFRARVDPDDLEALSKIVVELGYVYGKDQPYWAKWFEAIAKGDLVMFKKVSPPS